MDPESSVGNGEIILPLIKSSKFAKRVSGQVYIVSIQSGEPLHRPVFFGLPINIVLDYFFSLNSPPDRLLEPQQ